MAVIYNEIIQYFENKDINIYPDVFYVTEKLKIEKKLKEIYQNYDKKEKLIIFILGDYEHEIESYENQIILRTSADKSLLKNNEFILPYLWIEEIEKLDPLPKTEKPIIGFCGWNSRHRTEIIEKISNDNRLQSNFILRTRFLGGNKSGPVKRKQFHDNIKQSHFIICNRGSGNFSMRFFETLASGRIPIVVDTDMQLPLHKIVPYEEVIIMEKTVEKVIEKLLFVWENKNIEKIQQDCFEFYEKYLHYKSYAQWLYQEITN